MFLFINVKTKSFTENVKKSYLVSYLVSIEKMEKLQNYVNC